MRCDESPTLVPRGLGTGDGLGTERDAWLSNGKEGPICRNDLRLKEALDTSTAELTFESWAGCDGGADFDFVLATGAGEGDLFQEKKDFLGAETGAGASVGCGEGIPESGNARGWGASFGRDRVDRAPWGSA